MTTVVVKNKLLLCLFLIVLVLCTVVFPVQSTFAYAETSGVSYDETNVLDDLKSSTVNGQAFNVNNYPFNENGTVQVIDFVEYCYSYRANQRANYGLYLYVYNPQGLNLSTDSMRNKVQMAVSYDSEGNATDYVKFDLQFCSKSTDSNYKNLFYKFKVVDKTVNGKTFSERVNSNERRYDVSGVELLTYGANNATDYAVNGTYKFTGYAEGYGPDANAKSTLTCNIEYLETIELEVKHTFYRTLTSSKGTGYQNQLDTVYFAVPNRFFEDYGTLQRIKAEWYEYKTNDIVVTSNQDFYNKACPYIGVQTGAFDQYGMTEYNDIIGISLGQNAGDAGGGLMAASWGWNLGSGYLHIPCATLYYLFKVGSISEYDPYATITETGGVESNELYDYILSYNKTHNNGYLDVKDGTISADLFASDIDDYRKLDTEYGKIQQGYSYYDFDADVDLQKLSAWSETDPSFWDNWITWGLWDAMTGDIPDETSKTVSPIITLKASDLTGTNATISDNLLINANDVDDLKAYYAQAALNDCTVVLFRFATSDYYSAGVDIIELNGGFLWSDKHTSGEAYRAWESVFLDFDIIQLSFQKDGDLTVIPVVSNPIDVVDGITSPVDLDEETDWWKILLGIILLILLIIVLFPILPYIIKFVFFIICLPFKAIGAICKAAKNRKPKENKFKQSKEYEPKKVKEKPKRDAEYEERYRKVMREDYPNEFYDEEYLDAIWDEDWSKKEK
ncbi:MAG: hypothetical protein PHW00_03245 [Clostridia bacterium]|nr:hypothetical protein [Clostridia bacterium]